MSNNNQKCGIWPIKKNKATQKIDPSCMFPPPANHPIYGGSAPTKEPGTTANAVTFFNGVYMALYDNKVRKLVRKTMIGKLTIKIKAPYAKKESATSHAAFRLILPDGSGLFFVRGINASVLYS